MASRYIRITFLAFLLFFVKVHGGPVHQKNSLFTQPDGSVISVMVSGDEWMKIRKTPDGCAIVKDEDGWWCYATYDNEGQIHSTGYHVGEAPSEIIVASRNIPYDLLSEKAAKRRSVGEETALKTIQHIRKSMVQTRSSEKSATKKGIALLVEFTDIKFTFKREDFVNLLNQKGYNGTGSAKDYYEDQFGEGWEFTFEVSDIITLPWPAEHYGRNDASGLDLRPCEMVAEACEAIDDKINFADFDQDNDGFVDNVYVFYAGLSESEHTDQPDLIWPHLYYVYQGGGITTICDDKYIDRYSCSSEITGTRSVAGIGAFCHEYGHSLGLKDLYDTDHDTSGGWAAGTWSYTSLMDAGNYNNNSATPPNLNCIEREMLGISTPISIEAGNTYTLEPIHKNGTCYRLDSSTEGEYYLFECRSNEGWDEYIRGKGMLVYHIDKNATEEYAGYHYSKWDFNTINADQSHQCADLIEADGRSDLIVTGEEFKQSMTGLYFPQDKATSLTPYSTPAITFWDGEISEISITGIRKDGDNIIFNAINTASLSDVPSVTEPEFIVFPDAAIIRFAKSDPLEEGSPVLEWRRSNSSDNYTTVIPVEYSTGKYACKLDSLKSGNISYETKIRFENNGSIGTIYKRSFMTKKKPTVSWPYMYITDSQIPDGSGIALHVVNTEGEVTWEYNGTVITPESDFHYYPTEDGELKAIIENKDGSCDIITKQFTLIR